MVLSISSCDDTTGRGRHTRAAADVPIVTAILCLSLSDNDKHPHLLPTLAAAPSPIPKKNLNSLVLSSGHFSQ